METSTDKPSSTTGSPAQSLTTTAPSFAASIAIRALTAGAIGTPSSSTAATTSAFSFACVVAISIVFTSAIINSASFIALIPRNVISCGSPGPAATYFTGSTITFFLVNFYLSYTAFRCSWNASICNSDAKSTFLTSTPSLTVK